MTGQVVVPSIRPLGGLPDLEEGESFVGYLARYAYGIGLVPIGKVLDRVGLGDRPLEANALETHDRETGEELRQLLGLDSATFDRLRSWGAGPRVARILGHDIPDVLVSVHGRRCCPDCFRENPIHQARWDLIVLPGCSRHRTALRGSCSACGTSFRWGSTGAPCCPSPGCGLPFEEQAAGVLMGDDAVEGSSLVEALLRDGVPAGSAPLSVGDTLTAASVIGTFLLGRRPQVVRQASRTDQVWLAEAMRAGLLALGEWPGPFRAVLSILQTHKEQNPGRFGLRKELGPLAHWVIQNRRSEIGRLFGEVIDGWAAEQPGLVTRVAGVLRRRQENPDQPYLTTAQAAARLGIKDSAFRRFAARSGIEFVPAQGSGSMLLVPSDRVDTLIALQSDLVDLEGIGEILGLKPMILKAMVKAGLLKRLSKTDILDPLRPFRASDARRLLAELEGKAPPRSREMGQYSGYSAASKMLGGIVALVRETLDGNLRPVGIDRSARGIHRLRFDSFGPTRSTAAPEGMIRYCDVWERMALPRNTVSELMSAGLFEGIDPDGRRRQGAYFAPIAAIEKFERDYTLTPEIARRAGLPWQGMAGRLAALGVLPVSGPNVDGRTRHVFRRDEVEAVLKDLGS
ncbi:TniQ family protein [Pararoseomonas sp. SCSIO 73927]|uniref:TniQ family protein n=1 Tax=Pararoseomonas sp. SCSIO 73927 TaxID=3114537 RepID=UPI0030D5D69B